MLSGPDHLHRELPGKLGELRAMRSEYSDSTMRPDPEQFPTVKRRKPPKRGKEPTSPANKLDLMVRAALGAVRQVRPTHEHGRHHPEIAVPSQDAEWWALANVDSALVSSPDGTGTAWYQRDSEQFRGMSVRSAQVFGRLWREWNQLAQQYRAAAPEFTSSASWRATIEATTPNDAGG